MNGRKRILTAGVLVAILVLVLALLAHLLSSGQDAAQEQTADSVEAMLNLLAQSQKYRASIAVEPMLELEDIWAIEDARDESRAPLVKGMRNGDQEMGYDAASDTFYCTIGLETGEGFPELALFAQGADDAQNLRIVWVDDYSYDYASDAVREGWRYELLAYTDTEYAYFGVVFTGLPIVTLHVSGGVEALGEEYTAASFSVSGAGYEGVTSGAMVHLRGGGFVKEYPKYSYRVELHTLSAHGDEKSSVSVLGMPADSDWILISNAADSTCARNELAWSIWRDWNEDGQGFMIQQTRMVEVFVDDEYVGLYQLMQRINVREEIVRMGGSLNTDYCARVIKDVNIEDRPVIDLMDSVNYWLELRYAPRRVSAQNAFAQFKPLWQMTTNVKQHELWIDDATFAEMAGQYLDVREMIDFFLFTQTAGLGYDNVFNNVYIWALRQGDRYVYHFSPWDMDMAFTKMLGFEEDAPNLYLFQAVRMLDLNVGGAQQMIREIWNEKRATILTDDAMYQRFDAFEEMLNASGAYQRESEKWYGGAQELNLAEIQAFAVEHLHTIDRAIANLWPLDGEAALEESEGL